MNKTETYQEVVTGHNLMHISGIDADGMPHVRGVHFVAGEEAGTLFFITSKTSRKVEHIEGNSNISVAIDHDCPSWEDLDGLKYIKGSGTAEIIDEPSEIQKIFGLLLKKLPFLANLPGSAADFVAVRVRLNKVYVTDNTIAFGHTEEVNLTP